MNMVGILIQDILKNVIKMQCGFHKKNRRPDDDRLSSSFQANPACLYYAQIRFSL